MHFRSLGALSHSNRLILLSLDSAIFSFLTSTGKDSSGRFVIPEANGNGSKLELRIGGPTGTLIGEYSPAKTGGWNTFTTVYIEIDDVIGIQDLTLVGKGGSGVMNIDWFELSA